MKAYSLGFVLTVLIVLFGGVILHATDGVDRTRGLTVTEMAAITGRQTASCHWCTGINAYDCKPPAGTDNDQCHSCLDRNTNANPAVALAGCQYQGEIKDVFSGYAYGECIEPGNATASSKHCVAQPDVNCSRKYRCGHDDKVVNFSCVGGNCSTPKAGYECLPCVSKAPEATDWQKRHNESCEGPNSGTKK